MSSYNYEIGTQTYDMYNLEDDLSVLAPHQEIFIPARVDAEQGDGLLGEHGWGETSWVWGYVTTAMRASLRTYCPNKSQRVYVRLRDEDGTWVYCDVIAIWPDENNKIPTTGIIPEFRIDFRIVENLGVTP